MEQLTLAEFQELGYAERKERIRNNNNRIVQSMIENGYILKQIREDKSYLQDGYKDINDFAYGEFGYSTSTTSRFMSINTKFSKGGNSPFIRTEYANYGRSKLQEMLTMKEEDFELVTEETTVEQIREIKKFEEAEIVAAEQEEQRNLPLLQMTAEEETEEVATSQEPQMEPFHEVVVNYWEQNIDTLKLVYNNMITPADLAEELCPSGNKQFWHGIYMVLFYDFSSGVKVRYFKNSERIIEEYSYAEWMELTQEIITDDIFQRITTPKEEKKVQETETAAEVMEEVIVEEAPVAAEPKPDKVPVPEVVERPAYPSEDTYEVVKGQTTVTDIPEIIPEGYEESAGADHFVDVNKTLSEDTQKLLGEEKDRNDRYKREYFLCVAEANNALQRADYDSTIVHLQKAIEKVHNMQENI